MKSKAKEFKTFDEANDFMKKVVNKIPKKYLANYIAYKLGYRLSDDRELDFGDFLYSKTMTTKIKIVE